MFAVLWLLAACVVLPLSAGFVARRLGARHGLVVSVRVVGLSIPVALFVAALTSAEFKTGLLTALEPEDTIYAAGFSECSFDQVQVGMTEAEVIELLGEPLRKENRESWHHWVYAGKKPGGDNFRIRQVVFSTNRKVVEVLSDFYVD